MCKVIILNRENCLKVMREARENLKNIPTRTMSPYIDATGYEKEYKEVFGNQYDQICFITKKL